MLKPQNLTTNPSRDYELLDSGQGDKLERYGNYIISRPDPQALWPKNLPDSEWQKAGAFFSRDSEEAGWVIRKEIPKRWQIELNGLNFWIKLSAFKHTGVFPEQVGNWDWLRATIKKSKKTANVLNLFGYTGGATLAAAQAGANVCHLDGSKVAITWARENAEISGLGKKPIRWILDDAQTFVRREVKRNRRYDGIVMDPPAFGHGPNKELWKIDEHFLGLLELCKSVLTTDPLFFLINGYASGYSAIAYENNLAEIFKEYQGQTELGELTIAESSGRLLPCGIYARWSAV